MPPSGYSARQSHAIAQFLRFCCAELERESRAAGCRPLAALQRECANIEHALVRAADEPYAKCVLTLTRELYLDLASQKPETYEDFRAAVERTIARLERTILDIRVAPFAGSPFTQDG